MAHVIVTGQLQINLRLTKLYIFLIRCCLDKNDDVKIFFERMECSH